MPRSYIHVLARGSRRDGMYGIADVFSLPLANNGSVNTRRLYNDMLESSAIFSDAETRIFTKFGGESICRSFWNMLHVSELDNRVKEFMWKKSESRHIL